MSRAMDDNRNVVVKADGDTATELTTHIEAVNSKSGGSIDTGGNVAPGENAASDVSIAAGGGITQEAHITGDEVSSPDGESRTEASPDSNENSNETETTLSNTDATALKIRIDTRYSSFCIHRQTLKAIGDPEFIHWGYQPRTKTLMLLGTWVNERGALRVRFTKGGSCYVHSKGLIEGIRQVSGVLTDDDSYLLTGKMEGNIPAVSFRLEEAQVLTETEGTVSQETDEF